MNRNLLSFLGLALRAGHLEVGEEPVSLAAQGGRARLLLTASDAAENSLRRVGHLAEAGHCLHLSLPFSKAELGGGLGRSSVAMAAVTDLGMASAIVRRLADLDPEQYGSAAERMDLKVRRAAERKTAPPREKKPSRRPPGPPGGPRRGGPGRPSEVRDRRKGGPQGDAHPESRDRHGYGRKPFSQDERPHSGGKSGPSRPFRKDRPQGQRPSGGRRTSQEGSKPYRKDAPRTDERPFRKGTPKDPPHSRNDSRPQDKGRRSPRPGGPRQDRGRGGRR